MSTQPTDDGYLAKGPSDCCVRGNLHTGETRGTFETFADLKTYVSKPAEGKANGHVLLYFADIWALSNNALLVMDHYADAGYLVLGVDYLRGDTIANYKPADGKGLIEGFDLQAWVYKHLASAEESTPIWIAAVKKHFGKADTKYVCFGNCFGAPFVCNELGNGGCDAGAFAHPALLKDHHFENLKTPLLLSCAETDPTFGNEDRRKAIDIMQKEKKVYHVQLFQGVEHGFAVRCNLDDSYERWVKEQCHEVAISWFDHWVSQ